MEVKEAVAVAKRYTQELFADEDIQDVGLEEVDFDYSRSVWNITMGFSRARVPIDAPPFGNLLTPKRWVRSYKIVRISDKNGKVLSVKNREPVE
jgi:hypothetical protein